MIYYLPFRNSKKGKKTMTTIHASSVIPAILTTTEDDFKINGNTDPLAVSNKFNEGIQVVNDLGSLLKIFRQNLDQVNTEIGVWQTLATKCQHQVNDSTELLTDRMSSLEKRVAHLHTQMFLLEQQVAGLDQRNTTLQNDVSAFKQSTNQMIQTINSGGR